MIQLQPVDKKRAAVFFGVIFVLLCTFLFIRTNQLTPPTITIPLSDTGQSITVQIGTTIIIPISNVSVSNAYPGDTLVHEQGMAGHSNFLARNFGTATLYGPTIFPGPMQGAGSSPICIDCFMSFNLHVTVAQNAGPLPTTTPVPTAPISNNTLTITSADNNRAYTISVGNVVKVMSASNGGGVIQYVSSSNYSVLNPLYIPVTTVPPIGSNTGKTGSAPVQPITSRYFMFTAIQSGTAILTGTITANCAAGMVCPQYMELFRVTIHVALTQ